MRSKVEEYQELYQKFRKYYKKKIWNQSERVDVEREIEEISLEEQKIDFNNIDIVKGYANTYINNLVRTKEKNIEQEVMEEIQAVQKKRTVIKDNLDNINKKLRQEKVEKILSEKEITSKKTFDIEGAERNKEFYVASFMNKVFGKIFRFDFLNLLPRTLQRILGVLVWSILIVKKVLLNVRATFDIKYGKYDWYSFNLTYTDEGQRVYKEFVYTCIGHIFICGGIIIAMNILCYLAVGYFGKKYLEKNQLVCMAMINPNFIKKKVIDVRVAEYKDQLIKQLETEVGYVRKSGFDNVEKTVKKGIYGIIVNELESKQMYLNKQRHLKEMQLKELKTRLIIIENKLSELISKLFSEEKEVKSLIINEHYNEGIISESVAAGFTLEEIEGIKELISFKHKMKPISICYLDESADKGEEFRKNVAGIIERLMEGFYQENYHDYIDMYLVDFEGLYFPENRTKGLMKVIHTQKELENLYTKIGETKKSVDSSGDGKIKSINPKRLERMEKPVKYSIVFFVGVDLSTIGKENTQLFISGENFGFLPIIFMSESCIRKELDTNKEQKAFTRVLKKIKDNEQVYNYEKIVEALEYDLVVTDQKEKIEEKVLAKEFISFREFEEMAYGENGGLFRGEKICMDVNGVTNRLYEDLVNADIKLIFFTLDKVIPEFMTCNVEKF